MSSPRRGDPAGPERPDGAAGVAGAAVSGVSLLLRDTLLNGAVLLSLVVGVGGVISRDLPWLWLGPLVGTVGIVVSVAAVRERGIWTNGRIWAVVGAVLLADIAVMWLMWG